VPLSTKNQRLLARETYYQAFLQLPLRSRFHTVPYEELQYNNRSPSLNLLGKILAQDIWIENKIMLKLLCLSIRSERTVAILRFFIREL